MFKVIPFILYTIITTVLLLLFGKTGSIYPDVLFIFLGWMVWNMLEYSFHRFAFHNPKLSKPTRRMIAHGHAVHHRNPKKIDELVIPLKLTLTLSTLYFLIVAGLAGLTHASYAYLGIMLSYFFYELIHFTAHHINVKNKLLNYLKEYHLSHHLKDNKSHFMVTCPLLDILFNTFQIHNRSFK